MTVNKRKKNSRQRGSHTHGWGSKKKHRGAGNRGGRGMAGSGKRADQKKPSIWKERYFGKSGFVSKTRKSISSINLLQIQSTLDSWLKGRLITKEKDIFVIDMGKLGYQKVLSKGIVCNKLKIRVPYASKGAVEKVKKAGGEIENI